jgi:hypothetical protein
LTGSREKLLALLRITGKAIGDDVAVGGHWRSDDGIQVSVMSALVSPKQAASLAAELAKQDAFQAWLPTAEGYENGEEACMSRKPGCTPWIVRPTANARLDDTDPLGANSVGQRPRFTKNVNALGSLRANDVFQRAWVNASGKTLARSEAWGRNAKHEDGDGESGERLVCSRDFLRTVLAARKQDLLILIILRLYEKGVGSRESQFWHTTAVVHVKQSLEFDFYLGSNHQLHANRF